MMTNSDNNLQLKLLIYACNLCQQVFDTVQQLVSHKRTIHLDELYQVTYPLGPSPSSSAPPVFRQCYLNGEIVTQSTNVLQRITAPPTQPDPPPINVQMTNNISVIVTPNLANTVPDPIEMNSSLETGLPLFKENEVDLSDSTSSISCKYCGELFSKCDRDEEERVSCESCANLFGNTNSVANKNNVNKVFNNSRTTTTKIVLNSQRNVGLNNFASSSSAGATNIENYIIQDSFKDSKRIASSKGTSPSSMGVTTGNQNGLGNRSSSSLLKMQYNCKFCDKKFPGNAKLKRHEGIHTGVTYPCSICPKAYTQSHNRNNHEKFIHGLMRPARVYSRARQEAAVFGKPMEVHQNLKAVVTGKAVTIPPILNAALFGKSLINPQNFNAAVAGKSSKLPQYLNAVVSGKRSMEMPQNLSTVQDEEHSDDVPIIVNVSTLAVPKPISIKQEVLQPEEEENFLENDISAVSADSSLNFSPGKPMPPPVQYPPSKSQRTPIKKSTPSPVSFKCKYCHSKFKEEAHAKGHSRICFARFRIEKPSPTNFQFPSFQLLVNNSKTDSSPPLKLPPPTLKNSQHFEANNSKINLSPLRTSPLTSQSVKRIEANNSTPKRRPRDDDHDDDIAPTLHAPEPVSSLLRRASIASNATTNISPPVLTPELGPSSSLLPVKIEAGTKRLRGKSRIPCKYCKKTYEIHYIFIHERIHTGERPFSCQSCLKNFICQRDRDRHTARRCCKRQNAKTNSVINNTGTAVKIEPGLELPDEQNCYEKNQAGRSPQSFNSNKSPINSNRSYSTTGQPPRGHHSCRFCSYSSKNLRTIRIHENIHTSAKPYKCRHCNFRTGNPGRLTEHRRANPNCGGRADTFKTVQAKSSTSSSSPKLPTRDTATGRLRCSLCSKTFKDEFCLKIHRYKHTGQKPFACESCDYRTDHSGKLSYHRNHLCEATTGIPGLSESGPFKCPKCPKVFQQRSRLHNHQRYHGTPLPFGCIKCSLRFKSLGQLRIHKSKCTGLKRVKVESSEEAQDGGAGSISTVITTSSKAISAQVIFQKNGQHSSVRQKRRGRKRKILPEIDIYVDEDHDHPLRPFGCKICSARFILRGYAVGHILNIHNKNLRRGVHFAYTRPRRYKMWRLASTDVDSNKN